ncbi:DUF3592 domain-containing protein [Gelidibacter sp. F2691]|nr:DUF3592 domain-containing protein [Gelidibacter sp. F2691]
MFFSFTQIQISGLVAMLVATPFLIKSVRNFYLTTKSRQWPKISGTITQVSGFGLKHKVHYEYTVNSSTFKGQRVCFTNNNSRHYKSAVEFEKKYTKNQIINVFYHPNNPAQAVLEPGRTDGLMLAIVILSVMFVGGWIAVFL